MDWAEYDSIYLNGQGFGSDNTFEFSIVPVARPMNASFELYSEPRNVKVLAGKYSVSRTGAVNFKVEGFDTKIKCTRDKKVKNSNSVWQFMLNRDTNDRDIRKIYITCI